ncbi:MAG: S8 family serine peptidase [Bacteroidota bacterium]
MKFNSATLLLFVAFFLQLGNVFSQQKGIFHLPEGAVYMPGQVLVKVHPAHKIHCLDNRINLSELEEAFAQIGISHVRKCLQQLKQSDEKWLRSRNTPDVSLWYELSFPKEGDMEQVVRTLKQEAAFSEVEPRYVYESFFQPNDPFADTLGGTDRMWYLNQIMAREAWDVAQGDQRVIIGITDTGTSYEHEDLEDNLFINLNDPVDGIDNDQDGYVDNYRGWDFAGKDGTGIGDNDATFVVDDHGIGVTGIPAATVNNQKGTAGTSFNCSYLPIKCSPDDLPFRGSITHGYESILYAAEQGAQIIVCSWGGTLRPRFGADIVAYVQDVWGVSVVAACGNTPDDLTFYPAGLPGVLSVGNTHFGDSICCPARSAFGFTTTYNYSVDVSAPGYILRGPSGRNGYNRWTGTSFSAPLAAGGIGLVMSHFPNYNGFQAAERLRVTTDRNPMYQVNPSIVQDKMGTGRVNFFRALTDSLKPSVRHLSYELQNLNGSFTFEEGDTIALLVDYINYLDPSTTDLAIRMELPKHAAYLEILDGELLPGVVASLGTFSSRSQPFFFKVKSGTPSDQRIELKMVYQDLNVQYDDFEYLEFNVRQTYLDVVENELHTSVNSKGNFGFNDAPSNEQGLGVSFQNFFNALFEGGFLIGNSGNTLSDNVRTATGQLDQDFRILSPIVPFQDSSLADFQAGATFSDTDAENPLELEIRENVYAFSHTNQENYVILEFEFTNQGPNAANGIYSGLFADWDLGSAVDDVSSYDNAQRMVFVADANGLHPYRYGIGLMENFPMRAFATELNGGFGFSDVEKFNAIKNIPSASTARAGLGGGADVMHFIGTGPFDLQTGESQKVAFAIFAGSNQAALNSNLFNARETYRCYILEKGPVKPFGLSANQVKVGTSVTFTDNNPISTSWSWDFGDGQSGFGKSVQHTYTSPGSYEVSLTASDGSCTIVHQQTVSVFNQLPTSISSNLEEQFTVSPNPSTGRYLLEWKGVAANTKVNFQVLDLSGKEILLQNEVPAKTESHILNLSDVPAGIYVLKISSDGNHSIKRLIKW